MPGMSLFACFLGERVLQAHAAAWNVMTDGSDTNTIISWDEGSQAIQRAGNTAEKRDKIWVKEGTHAPASRIDVNRKKKTMRGNPFDCGFPRIILRTRNLLPN